MSRVIFERLSDHARAGGTAIADADKPRWVKRHSDEDADLMAKADIKAHRKITRQMRAIQFEHIDKRYFAFFGISLLDELSYDLPDGMTALYLTPGSFGVAIAETDIMPKETPAKIRDIIEKEFDGVTDYAGHDLSDVSPLFPSILVVEADVNLTYTEDIDRVFGAMVSISYFDGPIALSEPTLKRISALFVEGSDYIPYPNILQGVLSISWGGLYLELYRCIEQLYAVPRLINLTQDWKSELPYSELAELLNKRLSWRPKEDESLIKVIGQCSPGTILGLTKAFEIDVDDDNGKLADRTGRAVYALRNSLVHFRAGANTMMPTDEKWDAIISAMLEVVADCYDTFGEIFHQQTDSQSVTAAAEKIPVENEVKK